MSVLTDKPWALVRVAAFIGIILAAQAVRAEPDEGSRNESWMVLFSGAEIGSSTFAGSGFKRSLTGPLDAGGFVLLGTAGAGHLRDREIGRDGLVQVDHLSTQGSLLIGHQWNVESGVWALMLGGEADLRQPVVDGTVVDWVDLLFGVRVQAEIWLHPTETTRATGTVIAGTARPHLWARGDWGYRIWRDVHLGPEASLSLEPDYLEARIGLHASGLRIEAFHLRLSGGIAFQDTGELGAYATLGTYFHL